LPERAAKGFAGDDPVERMEMASRRLSLIAAAIVSAGVVAVAIIVSVSREERPTTSIAGSEEFVARSLPELAKASDAVIKGTVLEVGPGRTIDLGEGNILEYERATLRVDRVIGGSVVSDVVQVEEYHDVLQWPWREGDSGIYFLHLKVEPNLEEPIYRLTSSQGRFDLGPSGVVASNDTYGWVKRLESLPPDQFETAVEEAVGPPPDNG
jgi:hypothetical protein